MDRKTQYDEWNGYRATLGQADTARKMGVDYATVAKLEEVWGWPIAKRERWFRESGMSYNDALWARIPWYRVGAFFLALEVGRWIWLMI